MLLDYTEDIGAHGSLSKAPRANPMVAIIRLASRPSCYSVLHLKLFIYRTDGTCGRLLKSACWFWGILPEAQT